MITSGLAPPTVVTLRRVRRRMSNEHANINWVNADYAFCLFTSNERATRSRRSATLPRREFSQHGSGSATTSKHALSAQSRDNHFLHVDNQGCSCPSGSFI